ncbi:hypothetical protein GCM10023220_16390 [Streptomyces ziwulingensis]|uniref:Uncharacterized protein n=1 Tax=Streptomyces ziwulingensis TaxID=1045501 RepID=A0ABP9B7H3_9ACTN
MRTRRAVTKIGMTFCLTVATSLWAAGAAEAAPPGSAGLTASNQHCSAVLDGSAPRCFATLEQADEYAGAASVWVARFYDWVNYNSAGATHDVYVSRDCTATLGDKDFRFASMPSGWNDRVSSVSTETGAHCDVWFSSNINYQGECGDQWIHKHWDLTQVGCFDRASSFELS